MFTNFLYYRSRSKLIFSCQIENSHNFNYCCVTNYKLFLLKILQDKNKICPEKVDL